MSLVLDWQQTGVRRLGIAGAAVNVGAWARGLRCTKLMQVGSSKQGWLYGVVVGVQSRARVRLEVGVASKPAMAAGDVISRL